MTFLQLHRADSRLSHKEFASIALVLLLIGTFTSLDVFEDWVDGASFYHIVPEVFVIALTVSGALLLFRQMLGTRKKQIEQTRNEIDVAKESARSWKAKAQSLSQGISDAISDQFQEWSLTPAEQEVGFLLLKGLSIHEIAAVRETSERTVRQQAHEIYKKSGLSGRAQLSAFFLEDLFQRSQSG